MGCDVESSKPDRSSDLQLLASDGQLQHWPEGGEAELRNENKIAEQEFPSKDDYTVADKEEEDDQEGRSEALGGDYYEMEEIRGKRMRKGKVQFLIKWKGWPEKFNTWEPYKNVEKCSDILVEFEQRSSKRLGQWSKRKLSSPYRQQCKGSDARRDAQEALETLSAIDEQHQNTSCMTSSTTGNGEKISKTDNSCNDENTRVNLGLSLAGNNTQPTLEQLIQTDCSEMPAKEKKCSAIEDGFTACSNKDRRADVELKSLLHFQNILNGSTEINSSRAVNLKNLRQNGNDKAQISTSSLKLLNDKDSKEEHNQKIIGNDSCTDAENRKSGSIRHVSQTLPGDAEKVVKENGNIFVNGHGEEAQEPRLLDPMLGKEKKDNEALTAMPTTTASTSMPKFSQSPTVRQYVKEIVKAISYKTSIINGKQHVLVLFKALRSDGQEVVVDNKFLRATYPLLLLDFYEQHLRHSTPQ